MVRLLVCEAVGGNLVRNAIVQSTYYMGAQWVTVTFNGTVARLVPKAVSVDQRNKGKCCDCSSGNHSAKSTEGALAKIVLPSS